MDIHRRDTARSDRPLYDGDGTLELERYFPDTSRLGTHVMRYRFAPGTSEGEHLHLAGDDESCTEDDSDELYLVVAGELEMTVDGERTTLRAGDAAYAPTGARHGIANRSEAPAEMILVFGPPRPS